MTEEHALSIPVIDISTSNPAASRELLAAASTHGFVYVENNHAGISPPLLDELFALSKNFFALPLDLKEQVAIKSNSAGDNVGWLKQGVEKLDPATQKKPDVKEALNISSPLAADQPLPGPLQPHKETIVRFQQACQQLCLRILSHFARALSIEPDWFTSRHDQSAGKSGTILRVLYYPALHTALDASIDDIRAGAHSDYGSITLLFQLPGQPGLEIRAADGSWVAVPVDPTNNLEVRKPLPILVNIGDLLEDWTTGLLKSTVHRVVFPTQAKDAGDRYSIAYFCHPLDDVMLEPVPSKIVKERILEDNGPQGVISAREHLMKRLAATYSIDQKK
ncbi:hypothetical protein AMS68_000358 [Peltaster fructicola]|uniref:Fe2OG dioxygenase domain-containing protein n=1 Tax=Peltaster fructicola TaxID=286661 RepID=A0A6H0XJM2_9PEZI|nr:hypothetical protein AMS68_000358 [Peltaster fructicola]